MRNNLLHLNPILVTQDYLVIDGQHRLEAAKELGLPIYFQVYDGIPEEALITLNSAQQKWEVQDYVNYYRDREDVKQLIELAEKYDIRCRTLIFVVCTAPRSNRAHEIFASPIPLRYSYEDTERFLRFWNDWFSVLPLNQREKFRFKREAAGTALADVFFHPRCDKERLKKVLLENYRIIGTQSSKKKMLESILFFYNKGLRSGRIELKNV